MPGMHKNKTRTIKVMDDFNDELKESDFFHLQGCRYYKQKHLQHPSRVAGRRNAAAHPNAVIIDQLQTDAYIADSSTMLF